MAVPIENINRALDAINAKGVSDADVADMLKIRKQATVGWRTTGRISPDALDLVAELSGIPVHEIRGRPAPGTLIRAYGIKTDEDDPEDGDQMVDVIDIELSAGAGADGPEFIETKYRHTYRAEFLRAVGVKSENVRRCKVRGDSMERVLFDGDLVSIDISDRRVIDDAVYAIVVADQLKVKRLRRRRDGGLQIISENSTRHPMEEVPAEDLHAVYIVGRAFDKSGRGGL